ncbi:MAG: serine/threonine-protein kinase [Sandaracinaceae bacterium]
MAICPHCEQDAGDARFCPVDGTPLAHLDHPGPGRELTAGDHVDGRYLIEAELGRGGMGIVYLAKSAALGEVAVKVLSPASAMRQTTVGRFAREARLASRMDHPHLVRVYEFGFDPAGYYFLVMEVLEGRSLYALLHEEAPLAPGRALRILEQVASALARAHALGVVHRDMKAENVMIRPLDGEHVTVMDFGLSRTEASWGGALMTSEGQLVGTPTYMAPEQWRGEVAGPAADIYAFGVLAYELLCGHPPFPGTNVVELMRAHTGREAPPLSKQRTRGAVGRRLESLVHHCLVKSEDGRPPSMEAVHARIEQELTARLARTWRAGDVAPGGGLRARGRDALR